MGVLTLAYVGVMAADELTSTSGHAAAAGVTSATPALAKLGTGVVDPAVKPYLDPTQLAAVTVGPQNVSAPVRMVLTSSMVTTTLDQSGIPEVALEAYQRAGTVLAASDAKCHLPWQLVAAIGRVESNHGRFGGSMLLPNGDGTRPIRGLPLDGRANVALVRDTDGGKLDGDPNFDRAVGPMQFIPSTWAEYGVDANGDGKRDPNNIFDASLATAVYLCAGGGDLSNPTDAAAAVRRYNNADEYVHVVLALAASYEHGGATTVPTTDSATSPLGTVNTTPELPLGGAPVRSLPAPAAGHHTGTPKHNGGTTSAAKHGGKASSKAGNKSGSKPKHPVLPSGTHAPAPHTQAPEPAKTMTAAPTTAPAPQPVPTSTPTTPAPSTPAPSTPAPTDTTTPAPTPTTGTPSPSGGPSSSTPASPAPTDTTTPVPTPDPTASGQPIPDPVPSTFPKHHAGQTANIGWAPAMRQVVIGLLTHHHNTRHLPKGPHAPSHSQHHSKPGRGTTSRPKHPAPSKGKAPRSTHQPGRADRHDSHDVSSHGH